MDLALEMYEHAHHVCDQDNAGLRARSRKSLVRQEASRRPPPVTVRDDCCSNRRSGEDLMESALLG
jgi:hypothetical protein